MKQMMQIQKVVPFLIAAEKAAVIAHHTAMNRK